MNANNAADVLNDAGLPSRIVHSREVKIEFMHDHYIGTQLAILRKEYA